MGIKLFKTIIVCGCACFLVIVRIQAQEKPPKTLSPDDRFIRLVNVVEPRMTKRWKSGMNLYLVDKPMVLDNRSLESTPYIPITRADLDLPWTIRSKQYPNLFSQVMFDVPDVKDSVFITIFCFGTMTDDARHVEALAMPDKVNGEGKALVRVLSGVLSYKVALEINKNPITINPKVQAEEIVPTGEIETKIKWVDAKNKERESIFPWTIQPNNVCTLIISDTGSVKKNATMAFIEDSAAAKDAVILKLAPPEEPSAP